jgi:two-component system response regulator
MQTSPILLVDDNPDDVLFMLRAFKRNGFENEIVVAADGAVALNLLLPTDDSRPLQPSIVLLDVNMPRVNGLEVLHRLRENPQTQPLPVIMLTTSSEERDISESYRLGANSFVHKSLSFVEFVEMAKVLGTYWLYLNQQVTSHRN